MRHLIDFVAYFTAPPLHGGQLRVHYYNKELSQHMRVTQISFTPVIQRKKVLLHTKNYTEIILWHPLFTFLVVWLRLFGRYSYDYIIPFAFRFYPSFLISRYLKNIDVVQIEHPWLAHFVYGLKQLRGKKRIFVAHNVESKLYEDIYHNEKITQKVEEIETFAARHAHLVFCVSKKDAKFFFRYNKNTVIVPNGIARGQLKRLSLKKLQRPLILFAGSNHPPNVVAAKYIMKDLAPILPQYDFVIMGGVFSHSMKVANVIITGPVSDIGKNKWFSRASLFVNPIVQGSGSNLKMLEYMWFGKPIVSTRYGVRGFEDVQGITVASLKQFPYAIRNAKKSVSYAIEEYFYDKIVKKTLKFY